MTAQPLEARYLRVRNWHKFQHYNDRNPPWIKNYLDIDDASCAFCKLTYADQGRLQKMWRVAARLDNEIPYDGTYLAKIFGGKAPAILRQVDGMLAGGWLELGSQTDVRRWAKSEKRAAKRRVRASKPLAKRKQSATPEVERELETETSAVNGRSGVVPLPAEQHRSVKAVIGTSLEAA